MTYACANVMLTPTPLRSSTYSSMKIERLRYSSASGLHEATGAAVIELGDLLVHLGEGGPFRLEASRQPIEQREAMQQVQQGARVPPAGGRSRGGR